MFTAGTSAVRFLKKEEALDLVAKELPAPGQPPVAATDQDGRLSDEVLALIEALEERQAVFGSAAAAARANGDAGELWSLGAEAESFARLRLGDNPAVSVPEEDDQVWVLSSDTRDGVLAAWADVALMERTPQVTVVTADRAPTIEPSPTDGPVGQVLVLSGLATDRQGAVEQAAGALAQALTRAARTSEGHPAEVLIAEYSGGYKVVIPLAFHILEYLAALHVENPRFPSDVQLWFRHEYAPALFHRAALRRLDLETVRMHTRELDEAARGYAPSTDALEGFAYETTRDGPVLTPVGRGLEVLLRQVR